MTDSEVRDHRHAATLDDTFDFLNTDELDGFGRPVENLRALPDVTALLVEHGVLYADEARSLDALPAGGADALLARVRGARAALREVVEALVAGRPAGEGALAAVNDVLRARTVPQLVSAGGILGVRHSHVGDPLDDALARLAEPLVAAVAAGETGRLRICANDGCRWVFADASRTGRRRWCSMASCGNRAKASRHRARRRARGGPDANTGPDAGAGPDASAGAPPA